MPRCLILDTYYPDFLKTLPPLTGTYEEELAKLMSKAFGTADFYSRNLRAWGWEVQDVVANYRPLQDKAATEFGWGTGSLQAIAMEQIKRFKPSVVFMQDLSFFSPAALSSISRDALLAGQCSCPLPQIDTVRKYRCLFTSFPHYLDKFKELGVRAEYLPLAFDSRMLTPTIAEIMLNDMSAAAGFPRRDIDISFVGGVGKQSHWYQGTSVLEAVASKFPVQFQWYGYGNDNLAVDSPLRKCWNGFKWGRLMYDVYQRSKIGITRHGEVAQGFANNLRLYEITGMGALLFTEAAPNLEELFPRGTCVTYASAGELTEKLDYYLKHDAERMGIAQAGQEHTLKHHGYADRMKRVSEVLTECLQKTAA